MMSTSGARSSGEGGMERTLSRRMTRSPTMLEDGEEKRTADSELVPSPLASIVPILRVANEIQSMNPRVAYLCRFHAFEKAHNLTLLHGRRYASSRHIFFIGLKRKKRKQTTTS
ncbi:hypothetical protein HPP92_008189 [Vanilla planifolia]|uniref:Uncharacterized protein n=1 Tax=Vanilla planifolia TaxID=51239 RepID=A0A835RNG7_VANPL|nr:hypothetical protein HPP92_008189 [Vanilla planifolia]